MEIVTDYICSELLILVVFLWGLGWFLKLVPAFKAEWMIPFILLGVSLVVTVAYLAFVEGHGMTAKTVVSGIVQGVLVAAVAVFGNELRKQAVERRPEQRKKKRETGSNR